MRNRRTVGTLSRVSGHNGHSQQDMQEVEESKTVLDGGSQWASSYSMWYPGQGPLGGPWWKTGRWWTGHQKALRRRRGDSHLLDRAAHTPLAPGVGVPDCLDGEYGQ